tara:strand:+ start:64 stop:564 length:501 start_codon:yes stop_codon:yes gene_type:complete
MKYKLKGPKSIFIDKSEVKGRGVFSNKEIKKGEIVEECPFIMCGPLSQMKDKNLLRYAKNIIYKDNLSSEQHEAVSIKVALMARLEDEEILNSIESDLSDLGYENLSEVFCTAIVMGYGMMYNHSEENNIDYDINYDTITVDYIANKNIKKHEELFVNYGEAYFKK